MFTSAQNHGFFPAAVCSVCIGEPSRRDPRMPCGAAYPGIATLALYLSSGPTEVEVDWRSSSVAPPKRPVVLLSTAARDGVDRTADFVNALLERAWLYSGRDEHSDSAIASARWGAGAFGAFSRSTASTFKFAACEFGLSN